MSDPKRFTLGLVEQMKPFMCPLHEMVSDGHIRYVHQIYGYDLGHLLNMVSFS